MSFSQLKTQAKENLRDNWGLAIIVFVLAGAIQGLPSGFAQLTKSPFLIRFLSIASYALIPITIGLIIFHLKLALQKNPDIMNLFEGFQNGRFLPIVGTMFVMSIFIFFWTLLLIIPGIIKSISYALTPYI